MELFQRNEPTGLKSTGNLQISGLRVILKFTSHLKCGSMPKEKRRLSTNSWIGARGISLRKKLHAGGKARKYNELQ